MRRLMVVAALIVAATSVSSAQAPTNSMPDMTKLYHVRQNCHLAYDFVVQALKANRSVSPDEMSFARGYEAAADAGTPCPEAPAGLAARSGDGVVSTQEGLSRLVKYHKQKDGSAYMEAAMSVLKGKVPGIELKEAFPLIRLAAEAGDPTGMFELGNLYIASNGGKPDYATAVPLLEKAAAAGHLDAIFVLASIHYEGVAGKKNKARAFELFRTAAERGHLTCAIMAWTMLNEGDGIRKDHAAAYRVARNIAAQGQAYGAIMAASSLLQQKNAKEHENEVLYWLDQAAVNGDAKLKGEVAKLRPQVVAAYQKAKAPPEYRPRQWKACPMKTVCYVNSFTGVRSNCTTNKDYWNDCDG